MRPGLQCDSAARHGTKDFAQRLRIRADSVLQLDLASFIQHAVPTVAISQIESDGQCWLRNISAQLGSQIGIATCSRPVGIFRGWKKESLGDVLVNRPHYRVLSEARMWVNIAERLER